MISPGNLSKVVGNPAYDQSSPSAGARYEVRVTTWDVSSRFRLNFYLDGDTGQWTVRREGCIRPNLAEERAIEVRKVVLNPPSSIQVPVRCRAGNVQNSGSEFARLQRESPFLPSLNLGLSLALPEPVRPEQRFLRFLE